MTSTNFMYLVEASFSGLCLLPEEGVNQVDYISNLINSNSWQDITDIILDVITIPEGGAQQKPNPPQVLSRQEQVMCLFTKRRQ